MRHDYELQTDVLATLVANTRVEKKHVALIAMFAARTDFRAVRHVKARDEFSSVPTRVLDAHNQEIAADYRAWIDQQLDRFGTAAAVCDEFAESGYRMAERDPVLHYLMYDRSPTSTDRQSDFVQITVWEGSEYVEREIFPRAGAWYRPDAHELRHGHTEGNRFERAPLGEPQYRLEQIIDMAMFVEQGEAVWNENHGRQGDRQVRTTNMRTRNERVQSIREMTPGYDRQQWRGRRFFDDWSASSAGLAGERICTRWVFKTSDYTAPNGHREMDYIPAWTHAQKIAALRDTHRLDCYGLYGKLTKLDERVGTPFGWYFYGLHGNLVLSGQMERVLEAAEGGQIVLPEHDYRVLKRWAEDSYGF
ncbi:hypothetical protein [Burkholderia glumae]|uniref:hypothetical protein n=1 Tax=Burkholderia glumae TaxID=337 RepID=UPI002151C914|nr:hypothetical protein [Burkholderia glumae]